MFRMIIFNQSLPGNHRFLSILLFSPYVLQALIIGTLVLLYKKNGTGKSTFSLITFQRRPLKSLSGSPLYCCYTSYTAICRSPVSAYTISSVIITMKRRYVWDVHETCIVFFSLKRVTIVTHKCSLFNWLGSGRGRECTYCFTKVP